MKIKDNPFLKKSAVGVLLLIVYLVWRALFTLPMPSEYGWIAFAAGLTLLSAEALSVCEALLSYADWHLEEQPEMPQIRPEQFPEVDVMIATHNEDAELLFKTANACRMMKYPDPKKVHVWICDDTSRPEIRRLADTLGVGYIGMSDNPDAKAGNLNHAIRQTSAPLILTFDADMIPNSEFLMETAPYFLLPKMKKTADGRWVEKAPSEIDPNEKIGFIQTPQTFYNADLFQYNLYSADRIPNEQDYFFRQINPGKNRSNSPIYAGSNTVLSREALEAVGGIATGTITEDFETGLLIEGAGYRCYAIDKPLAKGLSPISIPALIRQRERWARGCIHSLRRVHLLSNPRFDRALKLSYIACRLYWQSFTRRLIYIFAPLFFAILDIPVVVCDFRELLLIWLPAYLIYMHTLKRIYGDIRDSRWSNIVDTVMFPYLLLPIWMETLGIREKKFAVTGKTRETLHETPAYLAYPHMLLFALSVAALIFAVRDLVVHRSLGTLIIIYWIFQNALTLLMAIFFMKGRRNERASERMDVSLPVEAVYDGKTYQGTAVNVSEGGFAFTLAHTAYLPYRSGEEAAFTITDRGYVARLRGRIVTVRETRDENRRRQWLYGVSIRDTEGDNKAQYDQIIYDREHTLPKTLSRRSSYIGDIMRNLEARTAEDRLPSARRTARLNANERCTLSDGTEIILRDFSFEYVRLARPAKEAQGYEGAGGGLSVKDARDFEGAGRGLSAKEAQGREEADGNLPAKEAQGREGAGENLPAKEAQNHEETGDLPERLVLFPGEAYEMRCSVSELSPSVYRIENFRELAHTNAWRPKLLEWEKTRSKKRRAGA